MSTHCSENIMVSVYCLLSPYLMNWLDDDKFSGLLYQFCGILTAMNLKSLTRQMMFTNQTSE